MGTNSNPAADLLPRIPVLDIGTKGAVELVRQARPQAEALLTQARRQFTGILVDLADRRSRNWLTRTNNPYLGEIDAVATELRRGGIYGVNLSYEWGCTCGISAGGSGEGMVLRRTLDWPFHGLGRNLVVAKRSGDAGPWYDITWPGSVGVYTAIAPGRFSAAINQAPLRRRTGFIATDWLVDRISINRSSALPPCHLLRRVFDQCRSYAEARAMLTNARLCVPVLYSLAGTKAGEGCVIERTEDLAEQHPAPVAVANHWLTNSFGRGRPRGDDSFARRDRMMVALSDGPPGLNLDWVVPPIANGYTRLAATMDAGQGALAVQGWERDGPATQILRLP